MLGEKMYVRCPADIESATDPRVFVCGQVVRTDEFKRTVTVKVHDPFNYRMLNPITLAREAFLVS